MAIEAILPAAVAGNTAGAPAAHASPIVPPLTRIDLAKWNVKLDGATRGSSVPAYFPLDENRASSVVEVASGANKEEVSLLALVSHGQESPVALEGGSLSEATDGLITIKITLTNADDKPGSFVLGDIGLVRANGDRLPVVGVSKWTSPLIAKFSRKSVEDSLALTVTVRPGKSVHLNYCFPAAPKGVPLTLQFGTAKTTVFVNDIQTAPPKQEGEGFSAALAGGIELSGDLPIQKYEAPDSKGQPLVRFESAQAFKKGDNFAMSGSRSMDTWIASGRFNGTRVDEEFPLLSIYDGDGYFAGKLSVLQDLTPINSTSVLVPSLTFTNSLRASPGDVLSAMINELGDGWWSVTSRRRATVHQ